MKGAPWLETRLAIMTLRHVYILYTAPSPRVWERRRDALAGTVTPAQLSSLLLDVTAPPSGLNSHSDKFSWPPAMFSAPALLLPTPRTSLAVLRLPVDLCVCPMTKLHEVRASKYLSFPVIPRLTYTGTHGCIQGKGDLAEFWSSWCDAESMPHLCDCWMTTDNACFQLHLV